jgi:hypothetical protein
MRESRTTSPPVRVDTQAARETAPATHDPRYVQTLALQRTVGNRATTALIQRKLQTIQGEQVHVSSDKEAKKADAIITWLRKTCGITIDSGRLVTAVKGRYTAAPAGERMKVDKRHWHLRELRALEKAAIHYLPILGKKRDTSTRKGIAQEVQYFGKATHSIDTNTASGIADSTTLGEYFRANSAAGLFKVAESDTSFGWTVDASLHWVCTHELAHGLMDYIEEDLRKAAGYWKDSSTKTGAGEKPWSTYAKTSLGEDLAESVTAYFIKPKQFKKKCPKRYAVVDAAVKAWKPAPAPAAAVGAAVGAAAAAAAVAPGAAVAGAAGAAAVGAAAASAASGGSSP